jgi:proline iminopeptidase
MPAGPAARIPGRRKMLMCRFFLIALCAVSVSCTSRSAVDSEGEEARASYFDNSGRDDVLSGGVKLIPISTPSGEFRVWTKRIGNNPTVKLLLLHGGPGFTHEYLEGFDSYLPGAGIEYYYYDQLGSLYSDQPDAPDLWDTARFVDEVEQVRRALGLQKENFFLYGHSWGGMLAIEYALEHQDSLKGLIISNMMSSIPAYNAYAEETLKSSMDPAVLAELERIEAKKDYENPRYMELLIPHHYEKHILRMPFAEWPDGVRRAFKHVNPAVYIPMQGPSELGAHGKLENWDRTSELGRIVVPTLVIGAKYDTMDPKYLEMMAAKVQHGRFLFCPDGSHLALYDDQQVYMNGLIAFIRDVDRGNFGR